MLQEKTRYTPEEYLAREEKADYKSEYYDGEIVMMPGGTQDHSVIAVNITSILNTALERKPCKVMNSDMRLLVSPRGNYTYPDTMIICGRTVFQAGRKDVVTNPIVIVEVLNVGTHEHDWIDKFKLYEQIDSLREYVLIDSERMVTCLLRRKEDTRKWLIEVMNEPTEALVLESLQLEIPLSRIYAKIDFQTDPESDSE